MVRVLLLPLATLLGLFLTLSMAHSTPTTTRFAVRPAIATITPANFTINASPSSLSIAQGASGTTSILTVRTYGAAGYIALRVSGVPAGVTATFLPTYVNAGGSAILTISVGPSVTDSEYIIDPYVLTVTGTEGNIVHNTTVALTVTTAPGGGFVNGGFETGNFAGWIPYGDVSISADAHSGAFAAQIGPLTTADLETSEAAQTFAAPTGVTQLNMWYTVTCSGSIYSNSAAAILRDNTTATDFYILPYTCTNTGTWNQAAAFVTPGDNYTLFLISYDFRTAADTTVLLVDDITLTGSIPGQGGVTNGDFEAGTLAGWTASGAATSVSSDAHSGAFAAMLGSTAPTDGDSTITQTFLAPSDATQLSFWYRITCPGAITDWATFTLVDISTGAAPTTLLPKTCTNSGNWVQLTTAVSGLHSYTLTLTSHDDNNVSDPTFTLIDDVTFQ
jgi:hypothetical protein